MMSERLVLRCLAALVISAVGIFSPRITHYVSKHDQEYVQTTRKLQSGETAEVQSVAEETTGDPMILGLSGQYFKFAGSKGAWYSAVSSKSFQWNLKFQNYENCPKDAHTFVSGVGFTFFDGDEVSKQVGVDVVNPFSVDVGCGVHPDHCLGAGSLELSIDGIQHPVGGDYKTKDGSGRIIAYNTFHQCSRKFFDADIEDQRKLVRSSRRLEVWKEPTIFDVIEGIKETMNDPGECDKWLHDRKEYSDLFDQPGRCSTILIKTEDVTVHLEYKQENQRCNAHSIDVWISSVSPRIFEEEWEGIIGETKDNDYVPDGKQSFVDRSSALKHAFDKDYEVAGPFSRKCKGCHQGH